MNKNKICYYNNHLWQAKFIGPTTSGQNRLYLQLLRVRAFEPLNEFAVVPQEEVQWVGEEPELEYINPEEAFQIQRQEVEWPEKRKAKAKEDGKLMKVLSSLSLEQLNKLLEEIE